MKRALIVLAAISVVCAMSFGSGATEQTTTGPRAVVNTAGFPLVKEPVTLTATAVMGATARPFGDMPMFQELEKLTNVKIEWTMIPAASQVEKINLLLASRDYPDIFYHGFPNVGLPMTLAKQNVIVPLDPYLDRYLHQYKAMLERFPELKPYVVNPDGKIYGVAQYRNMLDINSCGNRVYIQTDWLKKLGLKMPETIEEFYNVLVAFKTRDPNGNGKADEIPFSLQVGTNNDISHWIQLFGPWGVVYGTMVQDGKVVSGYMQPGFKEGLKVFNRLYKAGLMDPESFTQRNEQMRAKATVNDTLTLGVFHAYVSWLVVNEKYSLYYTNYTDGIPNTGYVYDVLPPLKGPDGTRLWTLTNLLRNFSSGLAFISTSSKNPELAARWIDIRMDGTDWGYSMQEGLKGVNWFVNDKGYATPATPPAGVTRNDWRAQNCADGAPLYWDNEILPQAPQYGWITQNRMMLKYQPYYDTAHRYPGEYFPLPEEEEIGKRYNEGIRLYVCDYMTRFITGEEDIDKGWDGYLRGFSKLGIDEVLKANQARYDRFTAAQKAK